MNEPLCILHCKFRVVSALQLCFKLVGVVRRLFAPRECPEDKVAGSYFDCVPRYPVARADELAPAHGLVLHVPHEPRGGDLRAGPEGDQAAGPTQRTFADV